MQAEGLVPLYTAHGGTPLYYQTVGGLIVPVGPGPITTLVPSHQGDVQVQVQEAHSTTAVSEELPNGNAEQEVEQAEPEEIAACKEAIYKHPMLGLLTLLFEKCENATMTSASASSEAYDQEIMDFVHQQEQEGKPLVTEDKTLDDLMLRAVQVLRIHLLEIEKVSELCKDFCTRYQARLKTTLQNEQLVHVNIDLADDLEDSPPPVSRNPPPLCGTPVFNFQSPPVMQHPAMVAQVGPGGNIMIHGDYMQPAAAAQVVTLGQGQVVSGGTIYQMVQTPQGLVAQPIQIQQPMMAANNALAMQTILQGAASMNNIGVANTPGLQTALYGQTMVAYQTVQNQNDDDDESNKKLKRGVLPKRATQIMKSWLFQHIAHPYPTEDEKRHIASLTNLSLLQVNNWFINGRRRILQPMIDNVTPISEASKAKKNKGSSRSAKRFWPENIANMKVTLSTSMTAEDLHDMGESGEEEEEEEHSECGGDEDVEGNCDEVENNDFDEGRPLSPSQDASLDSQDCGVSSQRLENHSEDQHLRSFDSVPQNLSVTANSSDQRTFDT